MARESNLRESPLRSDCLEKETPAASRSWKDAVSRMKMPRPHNVADFRQIYELHGRSVYSLCLQLVGGQVEAEALMRDAFLKLFHRADTGHNNATDAALLVLRDVLGYANGEVAAILRSSLDASRSLVHTACLRLRESLCAARARPHSLANDLRAKQGPESVEYATDSTSHCQRVGD